MLDQSETVVREEEEQSENCVRLVLTERGFNVLKPEHAEPVAAVCWNEVRSIRAYKAALFSYDLVCLAFETVEGSWVDVAEKSEGFHVVRQRMEDRFGIRSKWFMEVAVPRFEVNETALYPRYGRI